MSRSRRWLVLFAGWSVFGLVQALMWTVVNTDTRDALVMLFGFYLPLAWLWAALTPAVGRLARIIRQQYSSLPARIAAHIPLVIVAALVHTVARRTLSVALGETLNFPFGVTFFYFADVTVASYLAAVWAARVLDAQSELVERTARAHALETQLAAAQTEYLKLQLRPHFLFNTLSSVAELGHEAPASAARMLRNVVALLESAIARHGRDLVPLGDELETLSHYLAIERLRFADWLIIEEEIDDAARDALVPPFVLQPLAENAVQHGLLGRTERGRITVRASVAADRLKIEIIDNGVGLSASLNHASRGLGLTNVRARLDALYGSNASLTLQERAGQGTTAVLELPMQFAPLEATPVADSSIAPISAVGTPADLPTDTGTYDQPLIAWIRRHPIAAAAGVWALIAVLRIQHSYGYMIYRHRYSTSALREAIKYDVVGAILWLLLTPVVLWIAKKIPIRRPRFSLRIAAHAVLGSLIALFHVAASRQLTHDFEFPLFSGPSSEVYAWSVSVYAILVVIAHFGDLESWIRERDLEALRLRREIEEARFQHAMLELRPSVLLDALRRLAATVGADPLRVEKSLADIGEFLRRTLDAMNRRRLTVAEECANLRAYAQLLAVATAPRLTLDILAPDDLLDERLPNGTLRATLDSLLTESPGAKTARVELSSENGSLVITGTILDGNGALSDRIADAVPLSGYAEQGLMRIMERRADLVRISVPKVPTKVLTQSQSASPMRISTAGATG